LNGEKDCVFCMSTDIGKLGILTRREIEARLLGPVIKAFAEEFGRERTLAVMERVILAAARESGVQLAKLLGGNTLVHFAKGMEMWTQDDALEIEVVAQNGREYSFDVHRCQYAEMYRELGIPELGTLLSCNRDFALMQGFNPQITLTRTRTIMEGADHCDFRYRLGK
jgi:hypothetical protein